jgi:SAM-dependent methyltransferase
MEGEHSVSSHLRLDTVEYDRIIRTYIPHYDESRKVQLELLAAAGIPETARIVDLGGGTGSLAEAILDRFPLASVVVRDIDPEMLAIAQGRLGRLANRVELNLGSFADPLPTADAVLSAFALHHIPNLEEKADVYRRIREAVRSPGVFLNADAVAGPFGHFYAISGQPLWRPTVLLWTKATGISIVGLPKTPTSRCMRSFALWNKGDSSGRNVCGGWVRSRFSGRACNIRRATQPSRGVGCKITACCVRGSDSATGVLRRVACS